VIDGLVLVSFTVIAHLSQVASAHDLSLTQLRALAILRDRQPKMAELAAYLGLDRSSVSGLIDRAEARRLVRREAVDDDGRSFRVHITAAGRRLARVGAEEIAELLAPLVDNLSSAEQERLSALLLKLLG
jgi:DNA-binding MarR family transcriptional regulator